MPSAKKAAKAAKEKELVPSIEWTRENPLESCKAFVIELIVKFYETETTTSLDTKYVTSPSPWGAPCALVGKGDLGGDFRKPCKSLDR